MSASAAARDSPFELVGAPWIDGKALADQLNARGIAGVRFEAATFTPREWVYPGQDLRRHPHHPHRPQPSWTRPCSAIELMAALYRLYGDRFQIDRTLSMIGSRASLDGDQGADRSARHRPLLDTRPRRLPRDAASRICCIDLRWEP